ncbi:unnamed protein product [Rotaria sordida]|uniref:Uncharacterized protein n=1 Tax=Rotaria sordida TaxID=392033 RepID=A0A814LXL4_9BILA|nr:unnamed protein product [Rotaria sordida]
MQTHKAYATFAHNLNHEIANELPSASAAGALRDAFVNANESYIFVFLVIYQPKPTRDDCFRHRGLSTSITG